MNTQDRTILYEDTQELLSKLNTDKRQEPPLLKMPQ